MGNDIWSGPRTIAYLVLYIFLKNSTDKALSGDRACNQIPVGL